MLPDRRWPRVHPLRSKQAPDMSSAVAETGKGFATTSVFAPPPQPTRETVESVAEWRARNQLFSHMEGDV